jgi:hypothetical protein
MLNNFKMRAFLGRLRCQSVFQHLRCDCLDRGNNSDLQFIEGDHRGLVNNVLNVSAQEEIKRLSIG